MTTKKDQRLRRSRQTRARIAQQRVARLTVHRSNLHIYASIVSDDGSKVLASASTAEKEVRDHVDGLKPFNVNNAALITMDPTTGEVLAYVGSYDYYMHTAKVQGDYDHAGIATQNQRRQRHGSSQSHVNTRYAARMKKPT